MSNSNNSATKKKWIYLIAAVIVASVLVFAFLYQNDSKDNPGIEDKSANSSVEDIKTLDSEIWKDAIYTEDTTFGDGEKTVLVDVAADGLSVTFTIKTDKENLGDALLEHKLVEGEDGPYGLYIKSANGIVADYEIDKHYWSLSKNGKESMTGVSETPISDGEHYELSRIK